MRVSKMPSPPDGRQVVDVDERSGGVTQFGIRLPRGVDVDNTSQLGHTGRF
jgi:hypothetical protein